MSLINDYGIFLYCILTTESPISKLQSQQQALHERADCSFAFRQHIVSNVLIVKSFQLKCHY